MDATYKWGSFHGAAMIYAFVMSIETILAEIDAEIARLTQVRSLLAGTRTVSSSGPKGKTSKGPGRKKKRVLSPEARKRIADAQRKRWAAQKAKSK
jgi:50S ribosomal subunit-associated GTPase HflX